MTKSIADITEQVITRSVELREAEEKWRKEIEWQLRHLSDANAVLSAQVDTLRAEIVMQAEVCSQRR